MDYRLVGKTGVRVSSLCFGTMTFGGQADEAESERMFRRCLDVGINFFDTADVYSSGRSEEVLGALIRGMRDELVITSKVFGRMGDDVNAGGLSRRHITRAVENSLRRLGTDRLDFYFVHQFDPLTPIEEVVAALDDLVHRGLVLYPAVSNWSAWQVAKALGIAERRGLARFELIQPMYNLVKRQAEVEILPLALSESLGVIPYSPLGAGLLTGKYGKSVESGEGRLVENDNYTRRYGDPEYFAAAERLVERARELGVHPATLAVAWVGSHPGVTAPIIGARNVEQLEPSLAAADLDMSEDLREEISSFSRQPPPATDRTETQRPVRAVG